MLGSVWDTFLFWMALGSLPLLLFQAARIPRIRNMEDLWKLDLKNKLLFIAVCAGIG